MAQDEASAQQSDIPEQTNPEIQGAACAVAEHTQLAGLLEDARSKADEHWNQVLRANAELDNTRKRARQDVENAHKYGVERFAQALLPVRDSLEMGLAAAHQAGDDSAASIKQGMELTLKMFDSALEKFSVRVLNPLGEPFNPAQHQAMSLQESSAHAPDTVIAVMQKGYLLHDRLLRPAMVVVSKAPAATQQIDTEA